MKFFGTIFIFLLFSVFAQAQLNRQLTVDMNRSFHGSGDMEGLGFAVEYGLFFSHHLEFTTGLSANLHHTFRPVWLTHFNPPIDASFRMVTGGLQWQGQVQFAPLRTPNQEAKIGVGPVVRYQSSSYPNAYGSYQLNNFPEPVFTFRHYEPQNLVTAGYQVSLSYAYTFARGFLLGAKASFQNDTNSDVITQYGLRVGKRF